MRFARHCTGQCYVMTFPIKYGLPPMCVEGQTPDSPQHVKAVFAHMQKVACKCRHFFPLCSRTRPTVFLALFLCRFRGKVHDEMLAFKHISAWNLPCLNELIRLAHAAERKQFEFAGNSASDLAQRWNHRMK